jgi:hypothetical protein
MHIFDAFFCIQLKTLIFGSKSDHPLTEIMTDEQLKQKEAQALRINSGKKSGSKLLAKARKQMEDRKKRMKESENIPPLQSIEKTTSAKNSVKESVKIKESIKLPAISTASSCKINHSQKSLFSSTDTLTGSLNRENTNISKDFNREIVQAKIRRVSARKKTAKPLIPLTKSTVQNSEVNSSSSSEESPISKWENYANITNPTVIQNFTTPAKLLNDQNFVDELVDRLELVFEHAEKKFEDVITEADLRYALRTVTNLIHTACLIEVIREIIEKINLVSNVANLLGRDKKFFNF